MNVRGLAVIVLVVAVAGMGCSKKEEPAPQPVAPAAPAQGAGGGMGAMGGGAMGGGAMGGGAMGGGAMGGAPAAPRAVVVPDEVKNTWKGVVLNVADRTGKTSQDVTVDIGSTAKVGDLEIAVEAFLPSFTMSEGNITSRSAETENPAARLVVKDKGAEVFAGWLFSMYPDAHPFQHDRYSLVLKDFVKK